jgi:hypothetical protein
MICSSLSDLRETDITLTKPGLSADPVLQGGSGFICGIMGNGEVLLSQTAECEFPGGVRELLDASASTGPITLRFSGNTDDSRRYAEFMRALVQTIAETLPSTLTELLFDKSELDSDDIERLLESPMRETEGGDMVLDVRVMRRESGQPAVTVYDGEGSTISTDALTDAQSSGQVMCILYLKSIVCSSDVSAAKRIHVPVYVHQVMCLDPEPEPEPAPAAPAADRSLFSGRGAGGESSRPAVADGAGEPAATRVIQMSMDAGNAGDAGDAGDAGAAGEAPGGPEESGGADGAGANGADMGELEVVDIKLSDAKDKIEIKDKNKVYRELYYSALKEAKIHQQNAIDAYMRAKNIKQEYFQDDSDIESLMSFSEDEGSDAEDAGDAESVDAGEGSDEDYDSDDIDDAM